MRNLLAAALILAFCGQTLAQQSGLTEAEKKAVFTRLAATYKSLEKDHSDKGSISKRICLDQIGELAYPPSVSLLDYVLLNDSSETAQVAALVALGRVGTLAAVQTAFKHAMNPKADDLLRDAVPWGMRHCRDEKAAGWVAGTVLKNGAAKVRLAGVISLGLMRCKSGVEGLQKRIKDKDVVVIYEAVRALGMIGDEAALGTIHEQCSSQDWRLREAAAFALGHFKDDKSFVLLAALALDKIWQVRESAVLSLRGLDRKEAVAPLIASLRDSTRRVAVEVQATLKQFTGKDFGFDADLWQAWWDAKGKQESDAPPAPDLTVTYHGVKITSDRVLFVIDTSGSMEWGDRISKAKEELSAALNRLDARTTFNIMTFANSPAYFRKEMVAASRENVAQADEWLVKQKPFGGTNTFDTLKSAVEEVAGVDTIFFLSDGIPTDGKYLNQEKILAELNTANRFRKIRIHTIALLLGSAPAGVDEDKDAAAKFMQRLAEENQGAFIDKSK